MNIQLPFFLPALLGILFFSLSSFTCGKQKTDPYQPPTAEEEVRYRRITKDGFSLEVPRFMNQTRKLDEEAVLQAENGVRHAYLIIRETPLEELAPASVANQRIRQPNSLHTFRDRYLASLGFEAATTDWEEVDFVEIPELEAQIVELSGKFSPEGEETTHLIGFIQGPDHLYAIMAWTEAQQIETYRPIFEKILESFRLEERWATAG